ncbi:MAG: tRNA pseudouridine(38-40) synthase TruA [Methylomonas sp.]|nr:MAG: tRNA pseudouridine(38-40) synthase TruA [Methylomonas sp.]PPD24705.1 MAG: tRNA pseudouridine(38-40) synthase TruA [Methylomonas sp.]PPD33237.1 MAG: tRNA pseudouridine(38-40) synthase TruA [Methylomonas sp.]PPD41185.1 MAG: tRNA pseudouridine(38-40) synthase TruA [Methylomonas sp.]PPD54750.1 MAG: tRNA pseudouridine(38-40) synthase TruA [Methylomonas sp.]
MNRIVLGLEYDGTAYAGWQFQAGKPTVQNRLQQALTIIADQPLTVQCAGRTDAGVHALEQVVHFDCTVQRPLDAWLMGGNSHLPDDIRILWVKPAIADFHARYSAIARFYRYVILNRRMKSALLRSQATWCHDPLDAERMQRAAQHLLGEHDFSSFRAQSCQSVSPNRFMHVIDVYRQDDKIIIDICANAFLHHMVRNIVGVLMAIGTGKRPESWTQDLLQIKDRSQAAMTAPPHGLHLAGVFYPHHYGLPVHPLSFKLPPDAKRYD